MTQYFEPKLINMYRLYFNNIFKPLILKLSILFNINKKILKNNKSFKIKIFRP